MSADIVWLPVRRVRGCERFDGYGRLCLACKCVLLIHPVWCSQCGNEFPGNSRGEGYSECSEHAGRKAVR